MNRTFDQDQRHVYQEIEGKVKKDNLVPDANERKGNLERYLGQKEYNSNGEWLKELGVRGQENRTT